MSVKYCGYLIKGARLICEIMLRPAGLSRLVTRLSRFKDHCYANQNRIERHHVVFTTIDLKDGYSTIPIHPDHYKYVRFLRNSTLFEFICLPFGLSSAPGAPFSKVPRTFRARKTIRKTTTYLFCKAGLFIFCKGNENKNNCKVSCPETPSF